MSDLISRQAAIDASEKFIKDCNPDHFVGHQKFIEYMDNAEIGSFGKWQFANGFNMGLTATEVAIKKLPSAQPTAEPVRHGKWIVWDEIIAGIYHTVSECSECGFTTDKMYREEMRYCPYCGARMDKDGKTD